MSIEHISVLQSGVISNKINSWGAWQGPKAHVARERHCCLGHPCLHSKATALSGSALMSNDMAVAISAVLCHRRHRN